ncbi:MAG TPA: toll/interleukin-1 receptor domain-containing protein [Dehalococcoidia bacterium]|nr:toll/interleukin-1 receptor domain-containing protein [Dehalococcoidia bacterium]
MNPEHVEIVRQGSDAINTWRSAHPAQRLDLSGADLPLAKLAEVDLSRANLSMTNLLEADLSGTLLYGADLSHSIISGAHLAQADLFEANLTDAILSGADLFAANLSQANLARVDLSATECYITDLSGAALGQADLSYATLDRANLSRTVFSGATFNETVFADCDLSVALGLDAVRHEGPSTLGLDTVIRSRGQIPPAFLRGVGVPDSVAAYVRSLNTEAPPFYTCFISYSSRDQEFARRLYADLQLRGVRCWTFPETSTVGRRVWKKADRAIRVYDKLLVICSGNSLQNPQVLRELDRAILKEQAIARDNEQVHRETGNGLGTLRTRDPEVLLMVRIDNYVFDGWQHPRKTDLTRRSIGDFVGWSQSPRKYDHSLAILLHALDPKTWPAAE